MIANLTAGSMFAETMGRVRVGQGGQGRGERGRVGEGIRARNCKI